MPTARAFWAILTTGSSTLRPSRSIRSASSSMTTTMNGIGLPRAPRAEALYAAMLRSIALRQLLVALLHLVDDVGQHGARLVRLDDDRHLEVRQVAIRGELDALEVDQDQPHLVGRRRASGGW